MHELITHQPEGLRRGVTASKADTAGPCRTPAELQQDARGAPPIRDPSCARRHGSAGAPKAPTGMGHRWRCRADARVRGGVWWQQAGIVREALGHAKAKSQCGDGVDWRCEGRPAPLAAPPSLPDILE